MKKGLFFAVFGILLFSLFAFGSSMPGPDAEALWTHMTETSPYTQWENFPDHTGMQEGKAPHGPLHIVYADKTTLSADSPPYPEGSIIVKENYGKDKELKALTVMYKIKGYDPEAGDWFYAKYSPEGGVGAAGKINGCKKCHAGVKSRDYVFVHEF